jgi:CTP:phosphocholine cytidylyltransferase-like protein
VKGTLGVLEQYYKAVNGSVLAGPTYFAEMFGKIKLNILENMVDSGENNKLYHVAVIITDGCCHDMEATRKILVEMSSMPISVVIIGVGTGEFE